MIAIEGAAGADRSPEPASGTYRRLLCAGFGAPEAANLTALKNGLGICSRPWVVRELTHLLFLRELRRRGSQWSGSNDRADSAGRIPISAIAERTTPPDRGDRDSATRVGSTRRDAEDPTDGRVTLLKLFRAMTGPNATLALLDPTASQRPDAADCADREDG